MGKLNLAATMDALADAIIPAIKNVYPWPVDNVVVPCAVIGYPEEIEFDQTFGRGSDRAVFPVYFVVGRVIDRVARDYLSAVISGQDEIKELIDTTIETATTTDCKVQPLTIGNVEYIAAVFRVEVYS